MIHPSVPLGSAHRFLACRATAIFLVNVACRICELGVQRANERLHVSLVWQYVFDKSCKSSCVQRKVCGDGQKHMLMGSAAKFEYRMSLTE